MRPLLLDLFCGAGGAAMGYHRAGFDVVGVDINPQPHYPFPFVQGDALAPAVRLEAFDAVHASPPCQRYSVTRHSHAYLQKDRPDLLGPARDLLATFDGPTVIENVIGAPMRRDIVLCGSMFGLSAYDPDMGKVVHLKRHRAFEVDGFGVMSPPDACTVLRGSIAGVYGGGGEARSLALRNGRSGGRRGGYTPRADVRRELMGMPWATMGGVNEAIPPAYTEHIGHQLLEAVKK